jgi:hypothetical protein
MSDKIQMTEEQAVEMLNELWMHLKAGGFSYTPESTIWQMKERGYIKKSELEIYAESFYSLEPKDINYGNCIDYIEELEKEIEKLKNE